MRKGCKSKHIPDKSLCGDYVMPPMNSPATLQEDCIRSAEIYLKYLEENRETGSGMLRAQVRSVQNTLLDTNLVMQVDREIRNADSITLRIGGTVYENLEGHTSFVIQSIDKRRITITPSPEVAEHIDRAVHKREKMVRLLLHGVYRYTDYGMISQYPALVFPIRFILPSSESLSSAL